MSVEEAAIVAKAGYHHGDLKAQLVEAVRQLVEEKGPDEFSIAEASRLAGVSTAAPYKHFKDRHAILHAVALDGMERLEAAMRAAITDLPKGSLARIDALGQAYIDFARSGPGVFRLTFGLTDGHDAEPELMDCGRSCFEILLGAVADVLERPMDAPEVGLRAYMLWTFVHGHCFLILDNKLTKMELEIDEPFLLSQVSQAIFGNARGGQAAG